MNKLTPEQTKAIAEWRGLIVLEHHHNQRGVTISDEQGFRTWIYNPYDPAENRKIEKKLMRLKWQFGMMAVGEDYFGLHLNSDLATASTLKQVIIDAALEEINL